MSLLKFNHTSSFQIFQILKYGALILVNIALAKTFLPLSDLGKYESFLFISSTVSFFWVTGTMQALLSIYPSGSNSENNNSSIFFSSFILLLVLSIISAVVISTTFSFNTMVSFSSTEKLLLIGFLLINPTSFLIEYLLLLKARYKELIVFGIVTLLVPCLIIPLPAYFGLSVEFCFYSLVFWAILKFLLLTRLLVKYSEIVLKKKEVLRILKTAMPLISTALVVGSASYIDGFIITTNYDANTFAVFRFGAKEFPLFLLIASSFSNSMIPLISKKEKLQEELGKIKLKAKQMVYYLFPLAIIFMLTSQFIFPFIYNTDFKESHKIFDIYLILIVSRFLFPQSILMGLKMHKTIFYISLIELFVNIISSLVFIRYFGFIGVAYGTLTAYFTEKLLLIYLVERKIGIKAKEYVPVYVLIPYSLLLISIYLLKITLA